MGPRESYHIFRFRVVPALKTRYRQLFFEKIKEIDVFKVDGFNHIIWNGKSNKSYGKFRKSLISSKNCMFFSKIYEAIIFCFCIPPVFVCYGWFDLQERLDKLPFLNCTGSRWMICNLNLQQFKNQFGLRAKSFIDGLAWYTDMQRLIETLIRNMLL